MSQFSSSKHKQREKLVAQFMSFTHTNEKNAVSFLSQYDWRLDMATDAFYNSADPMVGNDSVNARRNSSKANVDRKKLDQLWNMYKGLHAAYLAN